MTHEDIAAILAQNNAGEQQAIEGYYRILSIPGLAHALRKDIEEIIADEMNHSQKLSHWVTQLTGVHPSKD